MAKKKTSRRMTAVRKTSGRVDPKKVEAILVECALAVGAGVGHKGTKGISPEAADTWRKIFRPSIVRALREGNSWPKARANALSGVGTEAFPAASATSRWSLS